jgi:hypothetical protein
MHKPKGNAAPQNSLRLEMNLPVVPNLPRVLSYLQAGFWYSTSKRFTCVVRSRLLRVVSLKYSFSQTTCF